MKNNHSNLIWLFSLEISFLLTSFEIRRDKVSLSIFSNDAKLVILEKVISLLFK